MFHKKVYKVVLSTSFIPALLTTFSILLTSNNQIISALKCYRGQQNASIPVNGQPIDCPSGSITCQKVFEPSMNIVQRDCGVTNCTVNNLISTTGGCTNSNSYPYNTYCCCYEDGCNSAQHITFIAAFNWRSVAILMFFILISILLSLQLHI